MIPHKEESVESIENQEINSQENHLHMGNNFLGHVPVQDPFQRSHKQMLGTAEDDENWMLKIDLFDEEDI